MLCWQWLAWFWSHWTANLLPQCQAFCSAWAPVFPVLFTRHFHCYTQLTLPFIWCNSRLASSVPWAMPVWAKPCFSSLAWVLSIYSLIWHRHYSFFSLALKSSASSSSHGPNSWDSFSWLSVSEKNSPWKNPHNKKFLISPLFLGLPCSAPLLSQLACSVASRLALAWTFC